MSMESIRIENMYDLNETIAAEIFEGKTYPWEVLPLIKEFIVKLGNTLDPEEYDKIGEDIWVAKSAKIAPTVALNGPCIIGKDAEVRQCAFIRGSAIIGKNCVIGNSTEVKNSIIFDEVQIPHYNYVGDSILGFRSHLGAGAITSNVKNDKSNVEVNFALGKMDTKLRKFGAIVGDFSQIGCNSVLNPGTIIGRNCSIYPLSNVRGLVNENSIYKAPGKVVQKVKLKKDPK